MVISNITCKQVAAHLTKAQGRDDMSSSGCMFVSCAWLIAYTNGIEVNAHRIAKLWVKARTTLAPGTRSKHINYTRATTDTLCKQLNVKTANGVIIEIPKQGHFVAMIDGYVLDSGLITAVILPFDYWVRLRQVVHGSLGKLYLRAFPYDRLWNM